MKIYYNGSLIVEATDIKILGKPADMALDIRNGDNGAGSLEIKANYDEKEVDLKYEITSTPPDSSTGKVSVGIKASCRIEDEDSVIKVGYDGKVDGEVTIISKKEPVPKE